MHLSSTIILVASALVMGAAASPLDTTNKLAEADVEVDKRACAYRTAYPWQGGGCKKNWGGKCFQKCKDTSGGKKCCPETITSNIVNDFDCFPGYSTCECLCATN